MEHLLGESIRKPRYQKVIRKCMNLDPEKRYQSVREVRQAFFLGGAQRAVDGSGSPGSAPGALRSGAACAAGRAAG